MKILLEFSETGLADYLKIIKKAAALLTHQDITDIAEWDVSQAQDETYFTRSPYTIALSPSQYTGVWVLGLSLILFPSADDSGPASQ